MQVPGKGSAPLSQDNTGHEGPHQEASGCRLTGHSLNQGEDFVCPSAAGSPQVTGPESTP